jgi:hypothetical protein
VTTIESLIGFAEAEGSQRAGPPRPSQAATMARVAGCARGATLTVQSPPRQAAREPQNQAPDDVSMASSDPRARQGRQRAPEGRRREGAHIIDERRRDNPRRSNGCDGPDIDEPALGDGGCLPFEVGCPAFTRELWQVHWPPTRTFKPEIPEKYDGRLNPAEFLSIYTIVVQADGEEMRRCSPTTSLWPSSQM